MMMRVCIAVLRGSAALALVLGILFWTGNANSFIPLHIALGILLTLSLWGAGLLVGTTRKGSSPGLMISAFALGLILIFFGLNQQTFLVGAWHWIIQVVHLLLGIAAVILTIPIARYYKAAQTAQVTSRSTLQRQADSK
jgi:uncharacterized membrane protein YuzA (DUF378 family)